MPKWLPYAAFTVLTVLAIGRYRRAEIPGIAAPVETAAVVPGRGTCQHLPRVRGILAPRLGLAGMPIGPMRVPRVPSTGVSWTPPMQPAPGGPSTL